jgi:hypothetical protein
VTRLGTHSSPGFGNSTAERYNIVSLAIPWVDILNNYTLLTRPVIIVRERKRVGSHAAAAMRVPASHT